MSDLATFKYIVFKDDYTSYNLTFFENHNVMPALFILSTDYPNPFDPKTNFRFFSVKINFINISINVPNCSYVRKIINQKLSPV